MQATASRLSVVYARLGKPLANGARALIRGQQALASCRQALCRFAQRRICELRHHSTAWAVRRLHITAVRTLMLSKFTELRLTSCLDAVQA